MPSEIPINDDVSMIVADDATDDEVENLKAQFSPANKSASSKPTKKA